MLERRWTRWILIFGVWTLLGALSAVRVALSFAYSGAAVCWLRSLLMHLPASLFFSILKIMIESKLLQWFDPAQRHILQFPSTLFTYYAILGAIYAFDYYGKYRAHELKASQLQAQLAQAPLQALKMQSHPHFLFNTLHAISSLMRRDVEAAE